MGVLGPQSAQKKGDPGSKGVLGGGGPQVMGGRGGGESGSRGCQRLGSRGKGAKGEGARSDRVSGEANRGQKLRARGHGGAPPSLSLPSPPPLSLCSRRFPAPAPPLPAGEGVRGPLAHGGAQRSAAPGAHRGTGTPRGWAGLDGTEPGRSGDRPGLDGAHGTARHGSAQAGNRGRRLRISAVRSRGGAGRGPRPRALCKRSGRGRRLRGGGAGEEREPQPEPEPEPESGPRRPAPVVPRVRPAPEPLSYRLRARGAAGTNSRLGSSGLEGPARVGVGVFWGVE